MNLPPSWHQILISEAQEPIIGSLPGAGSVIWVREPCWMNQNEGVEVAGAD
jgi:hypothetical protein